MPKIFGIPNQIQKKQQYAILNDSKPDMFLPYVYKRFIQTFLGRENQGVLLQRFTVTRSTCVLSSRLRKNSVKREFFVTAQ